MNAKLSLVAVLVMATGCSASSSSSTQTISGRASAAPVDGGNVTVYALDSNCAPGAVLGAGATDANGDFSLNANEAGGPVAIVLSGGHYAEEATDQNVHVTGTFRLLLPVDPNTAVGITPYTEIAAMRACAMAAGEGDANAIINATYAVEQAAGLPSINIPPANPNASASNANDAGNQYALALAAMSQFAANNNATSLQAAQAFGLDFSQDGTFNGQNGNAPVVMGCDANAVAGGNITLSPNAWSAGMPDAEHQFAGDANHNHGGFVADPNFNPAPPLTCPAQDGNQAQDANHQAPTGDANQTQSGPGGGTQHPTPGGDSNSTAGGTAGNANATRG